MNEQGFRQILDDIAQEIPDDMDLWHDIQSQIDKPKRKRKPRSYIRWIAGIAAVLMLVAGIAGAVLMLNTGTEDPVAMFYNGDSGIMQVGSARLITDLNLLQKHPSADVNIKLLWAYADGNRIALGYEVEFDSALAVPPIATIRLFDEKGQTFSHPDFVRGGGGDGGGGGDRVMYGGMYSFDARGITGGPERIPLRLVMEFSEPGMNAVPDAGGASGGGGDDLPTAVPPLVIPVEPFKVDFDFSLPFIPAVHIDTPWVDTQAGIRLEMSNVAYAPSVTLATLCFMSVDNRVWYPTLDEPYAFQGLSVDFIRDGETYPNGETCGQLVIFGMLRPQDGKLRIQVNSLTSDFSYSDEKLTWFSREMREAGFFLMTYPGREQVSEPPSGPNSFWYGQFGFTVTKIPPEFKQTGYHAFVDDMVQRIFVDRMLGLWVFEFDMPQ